MFGVEHNLEQCFLQIDLESWKPSLGFIFESCAHCTLASPCEMDDLIDYCVWFMPCLAWLAVVGGVDVAGFNIHYYGFTFNGRAYVF